jgi:hypothetical protein
MKYLLSSLLILLLTGCATTQQGLDKVSIYLGDDVDLFFAKFGMPVARYDFQNNTKVFRWSSGVINYQMPVHTSHSGTVSPMGTYSGSSTSYGGQNISVECVVDFTVNEKNKITNIRIVRDTWGRWVTSRCAEIF